MKKQLEEIQNKYKQEIKNYLNSIPTIHEDYCVNVDFVLDHDFNEYFIININNYCKIRLNCEKIPVMNLSYPYQFSIDYEMKETGKILSILGENEHFVELIKLAEKFYFETDKILKDEGKI